MSGGATVAVQGEAFADASSAIVAVSHWLYARGWSPATSSNYSVRLSQDSCAITVSGRDKGNLAAADVMALRFDGVALTPGKPSAEAALHTSLYHRFAEVGAILHTHSITATIVSRLTDGDELRLSGYETAKALHGVDSHEATVVFPIFDNDQDIAALAGRVDRHFSTRGHSRPVAYLIRGHGLYTCGRDMAEVRRHLEACEHLLECELAMMRVGRGSVPKDGRKNGGSDGTDRRILG